MRISFSILFLLFLFLQPAFAGIENKNFPTSKAKLATDDTVPNVFDEDELTEFADSSNSFSTYDLYSDWDTVNTHYAKFNIETLEGIVKEIALFDSNSCGYVPPLGGNVTSVFGPRKRRFHYGTDIDLVTGDSVGSAFDGRVRIAKKSKTYGNVIVIRHNNGLETYYAHLAKITVEIGQEVFAGQIIGLGGNTGHSHGSHLHFEVRYLGQPINPMDIISFTDHKLISDTFCLSKKTFEYIEQAKKVAAKNKKNYKGSKMHVVKKGDTLFAIARKYGTTTKVLTKKNGVKVTRTLHPGQKIRL